MAARRGPATVGRSEAFSAACAGVTFRRRPDQASALRLNPNVAQSHVL
jgi:hypothetical protein